MVIFHLYPPQQHRWKQGEQHPSSTSRMVRRETILPIQINPFAICPPLSVSPPRSPMPPPTTSTPNSRSRYWIIPFLGYIVNIPRPEGIGAPKWRGKSPHLHNIPLPHWQIGNYKSWSNPDRYNSVGGLYIHK